MVAAGQMVNICINEIQSHSASTWSRRMLWKMESLRARHSMKATVSHNSEKDGNSQQGTAWSAQLGSGPSQNAPCPNLWDLRLWSFSFSFLFKGIIEDVTNLSFFEAGKHRDWHSALLTIHTAIWWQTGTLTCTRLRLPAFKNGSKLFPLLIPGQCQFLPRHIWEHIWDLWTMGSSRLHRFWMLINKANCVLWVSL